MILSNKNETYSVKNFGFGFVIIFLSFFGLISLVWSTARGTAVERLVVEQVTVATSARIISIISPLEEIRADGFRLMSPHVRLSVLNGCEGTESIILIAAAILAFPAPWRRKPFGLLLGVIGIFLMNQLRIVGLFYVLRYKPEWFSFMHGYIAPVLIILAGSLVFIFWLNWAGQEKNDAATA